MTIVSISEASRLTGKTRATIHRHINTGKLSKTIDDSGNQGIEISELIRVYSSINNTDHIHSDSVKIEHDNTSELNSLKSRLAVLEVENSLLKDHVSTLKQALVLLEYKKEEKEQLTPIKEEPIQPIATAEPELKFEEIAEAEPEKPKRKKFLGITVFDIFKYYSNNK